MGLAHIRHPEPSKRTEHTQRRGKYQNQQLQHKIQTEDIPSTELQEPRMYQLQDTQARKRVYQQLTHSNTVILYELLYLLSRREMPKHQLVVHLLRQPLRHRWESIQRIRPTQLCRRRTESRYRFQHGEEVPFSCFFLVRFLSCGQFQVSEGKERGQQQRRIQLRLLSLPFLRSKQQTLVQLNPLFQRTSQQAVSNNPAFRQQTVKRCKDC